MIAGLLFLGGCSLKSQTSGGPAPAPVVVATARTKTVPVSVHAIGNVEAITTVAVKAQVTGELNRVDFTEGDFVKTGQVLFVIDQRPYQLQVSQAQSNLAKDIAVLSQSKATLARDTAQEKFAREQALRYSDLHRSGILSTMETDQAQSSADALSGAVRADQAAIESAQASMEADKAALDRAKLELDYCTIRSPIDGRTGAVSVKQGNLVMANGPELTTINQVAPIYITFSVPEKYLADIRKYSAAGRLAVLASRENDSATPEQGYLAFVDNAVDPGTGAIKLKALFDNTDRSLWPGQFANASLQLTELANALTVPVQAVQNGQEGQFVFVVKPDLTVEMRPVATGLQFDQEIVVDKGLRDGERVVTVGQLRLVPGKKVAIQKAEKE